MVEDLLQQYCSILSVSFSDSACFVSLCFFVCLSVFSSPLLSLFPSLCLFLSAPSLPTYVCVCVSVCATAYVHTHVCARRHVYTENLCLVHLGIIDFSKMSPVVVKDEYECD